MADDLMAGGMKFFQRIGKVFGNPAVSVNGPLDAIPLEHIHDAPDARLAAVLSVGERCVIRFVPGFTILRRFFESFECNKKTDGDFRVIGPLDWLRSHDLPFYESDGSKIERNSSSFLLKSSPAT